MADVYCTVSFMLVDRPAESTPTRGAAREDAILTAAAALVSEIGYDRVTVDAISSRAHASKATMYRRWPGKAELGADALRRHVQGEVPELRDSGSLRADLLLVVEALAATFAGNGRGPTLVGLSEAVRTDASLRETVRAQIDERSREDGLLIGRRAVARGELADPGRGPEVVGLAVAHLFLRTLLTGGPVPASDRQILVDAVLLPLIRTPKETTA